MTLYRWALVDKKGKTRGTCEASNFSVACSVFARRRKTAYPEGWHVVNRGPVKTGAKPAPEPKPEPVPPTPEELLAEAISQSTKLAAQFQEALGMPEASWPDMVAKAKALSQFKAVHQSNTAAKLDKIKAALMGYDAAKLGGDAYSVVEQFI